MTKQSLHAVVEPLREMILADLDALMDGLPDTSAMTATVDVSDLYGKPDGYAVFLYHDPGTQVMFAATEDTARLRREHPDWPPTMAQTILMLAHCHVSPAIPAGKTAIEYYVSFALRNAVMISRLAQGFYEGFPHLSQMQKEAENRGNATSGV